MKVDGTWSEAEANEGRIFHSPDVDLIAYRSLLKEERFVQMEKFDYKIPPNKWRAGSDRFIKFLLNDPRSPWCKEKAIETRAIDPEMFNSMVETTLAGQASVTGSFLSDEAKAKLVGDEEEIDDGHEEEAEEDPEVAKEGMPSKSWTAAQLVHAAKSMRPQYELTAWNEFIRARVTTKAMWLRKWMKQNNLTAKDIPPYKEGD